MTSSAVALLALLFFAPLSFIYGRTVAGSVHAEVRRTRRSVLLAGVPKLVLPALVGLCLWMRLADPGDLVRPSGFYTGTRGLDALVSLALLLGSVAAFLFFLSVPFVMGRFFGVAAALAGWFKDEAPNPLAFGVRAAAPSPGVRQANGPLTIAIDGPAASGKGTLARRLADAYGLSHLDTGLTYRAVAKALIDANQPLDDELAAIRAAENLDLGSLDRRVLSAHAIGEAASRVAVLPLVRRSLVDAQRRFAARHRGTVLDGRDIGTVVLPDADVKLFVTASAQARARRRFAESAAKGAAGPAFEDILADLERRDARDATRADSPLKPAADARLLDTSEMDIEAAFQAACELVDEFLSSRNRA